MTDTPMSRAEFEDAVLSAVRLKIKFMPTKLPKLTGEARDAALRAYARELAAHMLTANLKPYRGPPGAPHTKTG